MSDHFQTLINHIGSGNFDYVLANDNVAGPLPEAWHSEPVPVSNGSVDGARVHTADVISETNRYHHDSEKLAAAIMRLYSNRNQAEPRDDLAAVAAER